MATDWPAVRLEYVQGDDTLQQLATRHGIYPASLITRADKEGWHDEREQARMLTHSASDSTRDEQLASFNADDLKVARAMRAKAAQMIQAANTPQEISALAKAFDIAHKIGRTALGVDAEGGKR